MGMLSQVLGGGFDSSKFEPMADFDVLPAGKYPCKVEASEVKATKAGTGHYLALTLEIADGPFVGRKIWDNINIDNPNQKCQEIGRGHLSALCRSIGEVTVEDEVIFMGKYVLAHVKVSADKDTKEKRNNVRTYSPITDYRPASAPATAGTVPVVAPVQPAHVAAASPAAQGPTAAAPVTVPAVQGPPAAAVAAPAQALAETASSTPWSR